MRLAARKISEYPSITQIKIGKDIVTAIMSNGREMSIPIAWFPKRSSAKKSQLTKFEMSPGGYGIYWPEIDEDIIIKAFVDGLDT